MENKPLWDDYFFNILDAVSKRASCDRGRSGCIIVKDNRILSTGYVGAPAGLPSCDEKGHILVKIKSTDGETEHCVRSIHAEQNAIIYAAKYGISLNGGTLYCTIQPCPTCAMLIVSSGIKKVICKYKYQIDGSSKIFNDANVELIIKNIKEINYTKKGEK